MLLKNLVISLVGIAIWSTPAISGISENVEPVGFETGFSVKQHWECTLAHRASEPAEKLQFIVTGTDTRRDISRRQNFQTDELIVSVVLLNLGQSSCPAAKAIPHVGFTENGLKSCAPVLIEANQNMFEGETWQMVANARLGWLFKMEFDGGLVADLHPAQILAMARKNRC